MDFDDLDAEIEQRIEEGDIESLEKLQSAVQKVQLKTFVPEHGMSPIPRDHRLPLLPVDPHTKTGQVALRAFVFYGPGGQASDLGERTWVSPPWLEMAVYEWPGHGTRSDEPPAQDLDALANDAFEAIKPSMVQVKEGGEMEGAPFAFIGQSVGVQIMTLVAKKVLLNFGIEPSLAVVIDRAPLHHPLLSEEGQKALDSAPHDVVKACEYEAFDWIDKDQYAKDIRYACEKRDEFIHKFDCDTLVMKAGGAEEMDAQGNSMSQSSVQYRMVTLQIQNSDEVLQIPVEAGTQIRDLKKYIAPIFSYKSTAEEVDFLKGDDMLQDGDAAEGKFIVKGLVDFKNPRYAWPHPVAIIGAGFWGVKMGMQYAINNNENFVVFDRHDRAGGDAWIDSATKHSRIQTDLGAFNVWFGHEYTKTGEKGWGINPEAGKRAEFGLAFKGPGAPPRGPYTGETGAGSGVDYNPVRHQVIRSLNFAMEEYRFKERTRFSTEVTALRVVGEEDARDRRYDLTLKSLEKGGRSEAKTFRCSVIYHFPGAYDVNRIVDYPGEKEFGGQIGYGMGNGQGGLFVWDDGTMQGSRATILGNGAFSVENVRSCCENGAYRVYLVTRRRSLPCPRVPCWFCHQAPHPTPAYMLLDFFKPMYELAGIGDPWGFYAVNKITDKNTNIKQSSRFGIGDVTFLACAYGIMEYRDGALDHLTHRTCHLNTGEKLEDISHLCKALGLLGDPRVDKLHNMTHRLGNMINGDFRRVITADATGMDANRFTTFSAGPGACSFVKQWYYLHNRPWEFEAAVAQGMLKIIPKHTISNSQPDQTVYMTNVQYEMAAGTLFGGFFPGAYTFGWDEEAYKYCLLHSMCPSEKFLEYCQKDWDRYQAMFKEFNNCQDKPHIPYPYTKEQINTWFDRYNEDIKPFGGQLSIGWDGPSEEMKEGQIHGFNENKAGFLKSWIPDLIKDSGLLKKTEKGTDMSQLYSMASVAEIFPLRQKYLGSKEDSSLPYDPERYDEWKNNVTDDVAFEVVSVGATSTHILKHAETWEMIMPKLSKKSSHHNLSSKPPYALG